jgi:phosphomevalonate kinase
MKIIVISGKQGSGKSTMAKLLKEKFGASAFVTRFAGPLYAMHDTLLPLLVQLGMRDADDKKKDGDLLQVLGTEYGRKKYGENVWCRLLDKKVTEAQAAGFKTVIIDDCRFRSELDYFKQPNVVRIRLECPEKVRKSRCAAWRDNTLHPSETDLDEYAKEGKFDLYVNTDDLTTPHQRVEALYKILTKKEVI